MSNESKRPAFDRLAFDTAKRLHADREAARAADKRAREAAEAEEEEARIRRQPKPSVDRYATGELRRWVLERDNYRCRYCKRPVRDDLDRDDPSKANVDHVIPYPEGRTRKDNLVTACGQCNRAKGLKSLDEFVPTPLDEL